MQIELVANPTITVNPGQPRPWKKMEVLYRNEGKVQTKILVSFKNPTVFKVLEAAKQGDVFEVESVKGEPNAEGKQFWEWKSVHAVGAQAATLETQAVDTAGTPAKQVTKMVVTEADRNRYIVRQSSLERAIETLAGNGTFGHGEVTALAAVYEAWVFRPVGEAPVAANINVGPSVTVSQDGTVLPARKLGRPRKVVPVPQGTDLYDGPVVADAEVE